MKAEINNENKAKFFALYYDQPVLFTTSFVKGIDITAISCESELTRYGQPSFLSLKPLSQISDEDAIECGFIFNVDPKKVVITFYFDDYDTNWVASFEGNRKEGSLLLKDFDYLRTRGYALPWMGISVEEMVEAGWIRLI